MPHSDRNPQRGEDGSSVGFPNQTSVVDPDEGRGWISVTPTTELTSLKANMSGEFLISWTGGGKQRVPNNGYVDVLISEAFS